MFRRERSDKKRRKRDKIFFRKRACKFCINKTKKIDYLDFQNFRRFTTERGKILPSRFTGNCSRHQRQLARAIKRARHAGLMPYVAE